MWSHLERGSSPIDWCESNYSISPVIAEFVNTVSITIYLLEYNFISYHNICYVNAKGRDDAFISIQINSQN